MIPQNHHGKSLLTLLLLNTANYGSHAFSSQLAIHRPRHASRHASLLPPLRYLSSEDEREETDAKDNHAHNKKPRRSFIHSLDRLLTDLQMTQSHLRHHPFLSGNYAPVDKELVEVDVQVVEGQIPKSISGAFCRNGPNPKREWMRKRYHWFDGREFCSIELCFGLECCEQVVRFANQFIVLVNLTYYVITDAMLVSYIYYESKRWYYV
jgi:hypothetical protein